jgi:hypothetical protein
MRYRARHVNQKVDVDDCDGSSPLWLRRGERWVHR